MPGACCGIEGSPRVLHGRFLGADVADIDATWIRLNL